MTITVARTCTELPPQGVDNTEASSANPLSSYRSKPAYVLLGDPGSGKTTEFRKECEELRDVAAFVTARNFVADVHPDSQLRGRTVFIDGLDEMRAGTVDARVPLDEIRRRLVRLGTPRFRVSCREADWLGPNDRRSLTEVSPDSRIAVLMLDPLSPQSVHELLGAQIGDNNVYVFQEEARLRGLEGMFDNPQLLRFLVDAVAHGDSWPESRLQTIDLACRRMVTEHNDDHQAVELIHSPEAILDAASHLCALLLLCGFEGYTLASGWNHPSSLVPLDDLEHADVERSRQEIKAALSTNLFVPDGERGFVPRHRLIAEFLAGRYLAQLIGKWLPARRVVDLVRGSTDGRVVTVLRGLSAWLAAHSEESRRLLIDADPVGVGLYGDIGMFTTNDKEHLLRSLVEFASQGPLFGHAWRDGRADPYRDDTTRAFRSLASADMMESIQNLLLSQPSEAHGDRTSEFVLKILSDADSSEKQSLAALEPDLMTILRDTDRSSWVTAKALDAYIHILSPSSATKQTLSAFLEEIHSGSIPDPDNTLRKTLLEHLYPEVISPARVWRYAVPQRRLSGVDRLGSFWTSNVLKRSSDQHVAELLDSLCEDAERIVPALANAFLGYLPVRLLARGLEAFGDILVTDTERLFGWLDVAFRRQDRLHLRHEEEASYVREWLEGHPHVQKAVYLLWLRRQLSYEQGGLHRYWGCDALHRSALPGNFGLWCLEQAIFLEESEPTLARKLMDQAYDALADPSIGEGLTLAVMHERIGGGTLARRLSELCDRSSTSLAEDEEWQREHRELEEQRRREKQQLQEDWAKNLRAELDDLRYNKLFAPNLSTLAQVYLGIAVSEDQTTSPRQRIRDFIGGDEVLVDAVMTAIRNAVFRDDVPEVDETISLHAESRHSWLAYPVLASLHLLNAENQTRLDGISEDRKRRALAIHYCVLSNSESQHWHDRWFQQEPELVLDVLYRCAVSDLRAGAEFVSCLNDLDGLSGHDDSGPALKFNQSTKLFEARSPAPRYSGHDDLLHDTRLRVLKSIPVRGPKKQMGLLDNLLAQAMQHPDRASLRKLAARKSSLTSMAVAQRIRWLAVDALLSDAPSLQPVMEYVNASSTEVRVRHLAEFLRRTSRHDDMRQSVLAEVREPEVLRDAIEIFGPSFGPVEWGGSGWNTLGREMSYLIGSVIEQLGTLPGDAADRALKGLINNPRLACWQDQISLAHGRQRLVHRDASYRHPSIADVQRTLSGGAPANAAALAALLHDRIADIAAEVRGGNDNPWRNYWSDDRNRPPTEPKHEDSCRDALLRDLKNRLPDEVDATSEGRYAADNRADIRASCSGFNVPVEIKKNSHPDLWTAMRRQLMGKYITDPATSGYGIYLVMWFGANETKTPPNGHRPDTPESLRQRLEQELTPDEAHKISVIVMDVTKPGG